MIWNLIGTIGGKFLDIVVEWNDKRSKWQINLRALTALVARGLAMYLTSLMVPTMASTVLVLGCAVIINS